MWPWECTISRDVPSTAFHLAATLIGEGNGMGVPHKRYSMARSASLPLGGVYLVE